MVGTARPTSYPELSRPPLLAALAFQNPDPLRRARRPARHRVRGRVRLRPEPQGRDRQGRPGRRGLPAGPHACAGTGQARSSHHGAAGAADRRAPRHVDLEARRARGAHRRRPRRDRRRRDGPQPQRRHVQPHGAQPDGRVAGRRPRADRALLRPRGRPHARQDPPRDRPPGARRHREDRRRRRRPALEPHGPGRPRQLAAPQDPPGARLDHGGPDDGRAHPQDPAQGEHEPSSTSATAPS